MSYLHRVCSFLRFLRRARHGAVKSSYSQWYPLAAQHSQQNAASNAKNTSPPATSAMAMSLRRRRS
jgi:hypothetical protein